MAPGGQCNSSCQKDIGSISESKDQRVSSILRYDVGVKRTWIQVALLQLLTAAAMGAVWEVERSWDGAEEARYAAWIEKIGAQQWRSLNHAIRNPDFNSLYDKSDHELHLYADCGDLPYVLRAYYAYKRRLPYIFNQVSGGRYTIRPNKTAVTIDNLSFEGTRQEFFTQIANYVHTGNYRTAPDATDSATYPIAIRRATLRPGAIFYSPEGHVAVVCKVEDDGTIRLIDAHPDQTVTRIRFSAKLTWKSVARTGGFRAFRTVDAVDGVARWVENNELLPGWSDEQYKFGGAYYTTVRERLNQVDVDPLAQFESYIREDIFTEVLDRKTAVEIGWEVGRLRAIPVASNIYGAEGDWENYSSPSRDLRLRRAMLGIVDQARSLMELCHNRPEQFVDKRHRDPVRLGFELIALKQRLFAELSFDYTNSLGDPVRLTLLDVERRLFSLSFDPNHPPELRWGAEGEELSTAARNLTRFYAGYEEQQRWRNRLEKKHGAMSLDDADNPDEPPPYDLSLLMHSLTREAKRW